MEDNTKNELKQKNGRSFVEQALIDWAQGSCFADIANVRWTSAEVVNAVGTAIDNNEINEFKKCNYCNAKETHSLKRVQDMTALELVEDLYESLYYGKSTKMEGSLSVRDVRIIEELSDYAKSKKPKLI